MIYLLVNPAAVELSVIIGIVTCLFHHSSIVTLIGNASCELWNKAPHSAFVMYWRLHVLVNQHLTWTAPFCVGFNWRGFSGISYKNNYPEMRLHDLADNR